MVWFNAKDTANALGYSNHINAINMHTKKNDKTQLQYINHYGYIGHPHSLYLNEAGLYKLIIRSKLPNAEKFTDFVTYNVLPSIRKYGYYKLNEQHGNTIKKLNIQLKRLKTIKGTVDKENEKLKRNLKKEKFPKGGLVYAVDYSTDEQESYRIGKTDDMNKRKQVIDTHTLDNHYVPYYILTSCPLAIETCIRGLLYPFRYKDRKDMFVCPLKKVKLAFDLCASGSKKVNYTNKSGSKTGNKQQRGGSYMTIDTNIIQNEINKVADKKAIILEKIDKLDRKIYR